MSSSHNLPLPSALQHLIDSGFWPRTEQESQAQHSKPLIAKAKVQAFAPDEEEIHLYALPFSTVADYRVGTDEAWDERTAVHLIDPAQTLILGDFGYDSDTLIALDYRDDLNNPSVIRMAWRDRGENNIWAQVAPNFDAFLHLLFDFRVLD